MQQQTNSAKMLIAGELAEHYFSARALEQQQQLSQRQIAALEQLARYVKGRFSAGQATAYQLHHALSRQNQLLVQAETQATRQATDAETLFKYGNKTLDSTLNARLNAISVQSSLIQSQLDQANALVSLYKALGGEW